MIDIPIKIGRSNCVTRCLSPPDLYLRRMCSVHTTFLFLVLTIRSKSTQSVWIVRVFEERKQFVAVVVGAECVVGVIVVIAVVVSVVCVHAFYFEYAFLKIKYIILN